MYSIFMINTYNESNLHRILKMNAATEHMGSIEQEYQSYICDVISGDGEIIEIQTKNMGNITGKILNLLKTRRVRLIYPLAVQTYIEYYTQDTGDKKMGELLFRRKSPKKRNIYHIFDELMGSWPILLHKNFTLEVIEVNIIKKRVRTNKPVQSANKKRRILRDWLAVDTALDQIIQKHIFCTKNDYLSLLPVQLEEEFTVKDICLAHKEEGQKKLILPQNIAGKMTWTLNKMGLIECVGKDGRSKVYKKVHSNRTKTAVYT